MSRTRSKGYAAVRVTSRHPCQSHILCETSTTDSSDTVCVCWVTNPGDEKSKVVDVDSRTQIITGQVVAAATESCVAHQFRSNKLQTRITHKHTLHRPLSLSTQPQYWLSQFTSHPTQNRPFWIHSSQPLSWLNTDKLKQTQQKQNMRPQHIQHKMNQKN